MKQFEAFGKYILLERLAAGGMAEVFLSKTGGVGGISKYVAIKRILPQYSDNPEFITMFKEEARIAMNLNHGNVVSIFDFGVEQKQFFLVMEYVEGQNLRQILNHLKKDNKDFTIEQCAYIAKQVAAGLDHAHRCLDNTTGRPLNITHRDMSPQNIMISFEGEVKVVDFGIAKAENEMEHTRAGTIKGKFGYMSPEQAEGLPVDSRTDIFSLGIVLWEILAKDRLFTANSEAATLRKIRDCQVPSLRRINPAIPPELERIVNKALAKDKSLRYQACSAFHRDLNRFLNIQYPDFSPQDFAVFMKSAFSQMYIENRKKQVDFAKVGTVAAKGKEEQTSVTKTETRTDAIENRKPAVLANQPDASVESGGSSKVDLSQLKTKIRPLDKIGSPGEFEPGGFVKVNSTTTGRRGSNLHQVPRLQEESNVSGFKALAMTALFVVVAIYFGLRKGYLPVDSIPVDIAVRLMLVDPPSTPDTHIAQHIQNPPQTEGPEAPTKVNKEKAGWTDLTSKQKVTVTIESQPPGARIYIDGNDQSLITPIQTQVEINRDFKLGLLKDGYAYAEKIERVTQEGTAISVSLQQLPPMGYLNINVKNGGSDPVLYINSQKVNQKLPLKLYGIPANAPVTVKVLDPFTQKSSEKIVNVLPNEKKDLTLVIGREASHQ